MNVLIVGAGFIGQAAAARLAGSGHPVSLAARHPVAPAGVEPIGLDARDHDRLAAAVQRLNPDAILLVHGPGDVTWCEANPQQAARIHAEIAANIADVAGDRRVVLISTDNVFDGVAEAPDEAVPTRPANAYGRAKLAAEQIMRDRIAGSTVLRVSLVYGWPAPPVPHRLNFFADCAYRLAAGQTVVAPRDHWNTPVHIDDVATACDALLGVPGPPLLHLGGPERIGRAQWARLIAEELGLPPERVTVVARADSWYACRPANACLSSRELRGLAALTGFQPRPVGAATAALLREPPADLRAQIGTTGLLPQGKTAAGHR